MTTTKQTATDTNAPATPGAEGNGGVQTNTDPLDDLLASYDAATTQRTDSEITPPKTTGDGASQTQPNDTDRRVNALEQRLQRYEKGEQRAALDQIVTDIIGDMDVDRDIVEGWLIKQATKDPRLDKAFDERGSNPQRWKSVQAELGKKLYKILSKQPDQNATEDRNAVAAAVKGASNRLPAEPAPDFSGMSNADFEQTKRKMFKK